MKVEFATKIKLEIPDSEYGDLQGIRQHIEVAACSVFRNNRDNRAVLSCQTQITDIGETKAMHAARLREKLVRIKEELIGQGMTEQSIEDLLREGMDRNLGN